MLLLNLFFALACQKQDLASIPCLERGEQSLIDTCLHDEIKVLPHSVSDVVQKAQQISDPIIRGAAVQPGKEHNNEINQQQGQQLCALPDGRDRSYVNDDLLPPFKINSFSSQRKTDAVHLIAGLCRPEPRPQRCL